MRGVDSDRYLNINIILDIDTDTVVANYCDHFGTQRN